MKLTPNDEFFSLPLYLCLGTAHKFRYEPPLSLSVSLLLSFSPVARAQIDAHKQHAEITCLKFVTPLVKKSAAKGPRCVTQTHTQTHRHSYSANNSCDRAFALDFINRKTSTQVSVSLAQRAGGDDDDEADEDPTDHTGR